MRNLAVTILGAVLLLSCHGFKRSEIPAERSSLEIRKDIISRSVRIYCGGSQGSGTMLAPGLILTAYHVVDDHMPVTVSGYEKAYKILAFSHEDDLALLIQEGLDIPKEVNVEWGKAEVGARVYVCGYPWNTGPTFTEGYVGRVRSFDGQVWISANALPGSSGSGVYSTKGRLLGVLVSGRRDRFGTWSQFTFFAVGLEKIQKLLEQANITH